jgi:hypothetical protein
MRAPRVNPPPKIDGVLDDDAWRAACCCNERWRRCDKDGDIPQRTVAFVCQDSANLYLGLACYDTKASQIRAYQRRRGGSMSQDDRVDVWVDVLDCHRDYYVFTVNPLGTQNEGLPGGSAERVQWKGDWRAAARITDYGWEAELAVPFSILRYPKGRKVFGLAFPRTVAREDACVQWPDMGGPSWRAELSADLVDIELPQPAEPLVLMPYALSDFRGADSEPLRAGLDIKRTFANGFTGLATVRPDFRTIEEQVQSVDFSYTERYLEERRPFFMEGQSSYFPSGQILYTRRIGDIDFGTKFFGSTGRVNMGLLGASKFGESSLVAGQYSSQPTPHVSWSLGLVDYQQSGGPDNTSAELAYWHETLKPGGSFSRYFRLAGTRTTGAGGDGLALQSSVSRWRGDGHWSYSLGFEQIGDEFTPLLGYAPERGLWQWSAGLSYGKKHDVGRVLISSRGVSAALANAQDGRRYVLRFGDSSELRSGLAWSWGVSLGERAGYLDQTGSAGFSWRVRDTYRCGGVSMSAGRKLGGEYFFASANQNWRASDRLSLNLSVEYVSLSSPTSPDKGEQALLTGTYEITAEKTVSGRLQTSKGKFNGFASYSQAVRRGTDVFILFGDPNAPRFEPRLAIKLVQPFVF